MREEFSKNDCGALKWSRSLGVHIDTATRYFIRGLIPNAWRTGGGHWRARLDGSTLNEAFDRIARADLEAGKVGLSLELRNAFKPILRACEVPKGAVERFVIAGAFGRAEQGGDNVTQDEVVHYRCRIRDFLSRDKSGPTINELKKKDTGFCGWHPTDYWLGQFDKTLEVVRVVMIKIDSKRHKKRGAKWCEDMAWEWVRGVAAYALALARSGEMVRGKAINIVEAQKAAMMNPAIEKLAQANYDLYEALIALIDEMEEEAEQAEAFMAIANWSIEKIKGLEFGRVWALRGVPVSSWEGGSVKVKRYGLKRHKVKRQPVHLNRLASEAYHAISEPRPVQGQSEPHVYWKTQPESVEPRKVEWVWISSVTGLHWEATPAPGEAVSWFSTEFATADQRWESFREKFRGHKTELRKAAAHVLGLDDWTRQDSVKYQRERIKSEQEKAEGRFLDHYDPQKYDD